MKSKTEVKEGISELTLRKHSCDNTFSELQKLLASERARKSPLPQLKQSLSGLITKLQTMIQDSSRELNLLSYNCTKLVKQGVDVQTQITNLQVLKEYFQELQGKVKQEKSKGDKLIFEIERWQLIGKEPRNQTTVDEQASLLSSIRTVKETNKIAREMLTTVAAQSGRLQSAGEKMKGVLSNINLSGNILQMLKTRTKSDNRLILVLSVGLVFEILLCIFVIRPYLRGS